jgi:hypothetical protein
MSPSNKTVNIAKHQEMCSLLGMNHFNSELKEWHSSCGFQNRLTHMHVTHTGFRFRLLNVSCSISCVSSKLSTLFSLMLWCYYLFIYFYRPCILNHWRILSLFHLKTDFLFTKEVGRSKRLTEPVLNSFISQWFKELGLVEWLKQ